MACPCGSPTIPAPAHRPTSCWRASSSAAGAPPPPRHSLRPVMSQSPKLRGLGRGLSALLGDEEVAAAVTAPPPAPDSSAREPANSAAPNRPPITLPIGHLKPGKMQPRTSFEGLEALID